MSSVVEIPFHLSLDVTVSVSECEGKPWGASKEELAANRRLLHAVLQDPAMLRLVVLYHLTEDLEKFDWEMIEASSIFVDFKEVHRRLAAFAAAKLSPEDQRILIDWESNEDLSEASMPFYGAFKLSQANLQVSPIVEEAKPL